MFAEYVDEFERLAREHGKHTSKYLVKFGTPLWITNGDDNAGIYALCTPLPERNEIVVDREKWDNLSRQCRRALIFHEAGHCGLGKFHAPGIMRSILNCEAVDDPKEVEKLFE